MILCWLGNIWAAGRFCRKYLEIPRGGERIWAALLLGGGVLLSALYAVFLPDILFALGQHALLIGLTLLLFRGEIDRKMLTASILTTITTLTDNFITSLAACLLLVWKHTWYHTPVPFIETWDEKLIVFSMLIVRMLAVYWLSGRPFFFLYQTRKEGESAAAQKEFSGAAVRSFGDRGYGFRKGYAILAIPLVAITLVIDVANWGASHGVMVRSGGNMGLYYDQLFSYAEFVILTALSLFAVGFYLFGLDRIYLEQKKSSQYHARIAAYQMLEEQYSQLERLRHDMKNHVIALLGLLENREWEKMGEYLDDMRDGGGLGEAGEVTGNKVVDVLLYQKKQAAQNRKIKWECDVRIPRQCCINEFDLCILFGNILDNAVEACERVACGETGDGAERFIEIQAGTVKKCFLLEARNSAGLADERRIGVGSRSDRTKNSVLSAKGKGACERQGIGLWNIRDMVERYGGVMSMEAQDGVFAISVLVPLTDDPV